MTGLEKKMLAVTELIVTITFVIIGESITIWLVATAASAIFLILYFIMLGYWYPMYEENLRFVAQVNTKAKELGMTTSELRELIANDELSALIIRTRQKIYPNK